MRTLTGESVPNIDPATTEYPYGRAKDSNPPSARNGTPLLEAAFHTDVHYAMLAVMKAANITPDNTAENIDDSQFLDAILALVGNSKLIVNASSLTAADIGKLCRINSQVGNSDFNMWVGVCESTGKLTLSGENVIMKVRNRTGTTGVFPKGTPVFSGDIGLYSAGQVINTPNNNLSLAETNNIVGELFQDFDFSDTTSYFDVPIVLKQKPMTVGSGETYPDTLFWNESSSSHIPRVVAEEDRIALEKMIEWNNYTVIPPNGTPGYNDALKLNDWYMGVGYDGSRKIFYLHSRDATDLDNTKLYLGSENESVNVGDYIGEVRLRAKSVFIERSSAEQYDLFKDIQFQGKRSPMILKYKFSTTLTAPPGAGEVRANNSSQTLATEIYIDNDDFDGEIKQIFIQSMEVNDRFYLFDAENNFNWKLFKIIDITQETGYTKYTVEFVTSSGGPFVDEGTLFIGWMSGPGRNSFNLSFDYRFNTSTAQPTASGQVRYNNATQESSTKIFINHVDRLGKTVDNLLAGAQVNDKVYVIDSSDSNIFDEWKITAVTNDPTEVIYDISLLQGSGLSFANNQNVVILLQGGGGSGGTGGAAIAFDSQRSTSNQSISPGGIFYLLQYNNEVEDQGGNYNPSTYRYTNGSVASSVTVTASARFTTSAGGVISVAIYKNGVRYAVQSVEFSTANTAYITCNATLRLAAGDYVEVFMAQTTGFNMTFLADTASRFAMIRRED